MSFTFLLPFILPSRPLSLLSSYNSSYFFSASFFLSFLAPPFLLPTSYLTALSLSLFHPFPFSTSLFPFLHDALFIYFLLSLLDSFFFICYLYDFALCDWLGDEVCWMFTPTSVQCVETYLKIKRHQQVMSTSGFDHRVELTLLESDTEKTSLLFIYWRWIGVVFINIQYVMFFRISINLKQIISVIFM